MQLLGSTRFALPAVLSARFFVASFPIALSGHYVPWPRVVMRAKTAANQIHLLRSSHSFAMLRCSALRAEDRCARRA